MRIASGFSEENNRKSDKDSTFVDMGNVVIDAIIYASDANDYGVFLDNDKLGQKDRN